MADRRRATRYGFYTVIPAGLSFVQDAVLEAFDGERASIVTSQSAAPGDQVVLVFREPAGAPVRCAMRVCSSTPIVWGPSGGFRLELRASGVMPVPQLALLAQL